MMSRLQSEQQLLESAFEGVQFVAREGENWFLLPHYTLPTGWRRGTDPVTKCPIAFLVGPSHPTGEPYAFFAPSDLNFEGNVPSNVALGEQPPFDGSWAKFSWAPDQDWRPAATVENGSNLLHWARSFRRRLEEGV